MEGRTHRGRGRRNELLFPTAPEREDGKGNAGKTANSPPLLSHSASQAWSSCSCLTPGEKEEEELLMQHVSKTCSAKAEVTNLENRSPWLTTATPVSAHPSGATAFVSPGYCAQ